MATYGVVWREGEAPLARGRLEVHPRRIRLFGVSRSEPVTSDLRYDELVDVRIGRAAGERLAGRPTLILERADGPSVTIASVAQSGVLTEIMERIGAFQSKAGRDSPLAVVVPLREGTYGRAREILEDGPPFDPEVLAVGRHEIFLSPTEAVFLFDSARAVAALEGPDAWEASPWRDVMSGSPRVAERVFRWSRPDARIDNALLPPGLHDDPTARA